MGLFTKKESEKEKRQRIVQEQIAEAAAYHTAPSVKQTEYISPVPASQGTLNIADQAPMEDTGDMVFVPKHRAVNEEPEDFGDVENPITSSFSRGTETEDPGEVAPRYQTNGSKQTHLNSLFNGHLMQHKYAAEEGTAFIRIPACKLDLCAASHLVWLTNNLSQKNSLFL